MEGKLLLKVLCSRTLFREKFSMICFIFVRSFVALITIFGNTFIFALVVFHILADSLHQVVKIVIML